MRVYKALTFSASPPWEYIKYTMCERFGWTLAYWDRLPSQDVHKILDVWDGVEKARKGDDADVDEDEADG